MIKRPGAASVRGKWVLVVFALAAGFSAQRNAGAAESATAAVRFEVALPPRAEGGTWRGRVFLFVAKDRVTEPRLQGKASLFGQDVREGQGGQGIVLEGGAPGYPERRLGDLPPGDYFVQALFNRYTAFPRADGHTIWAHEDQWEGQHFNQSPGNWTSAVVPLHLEPGAAVSLRLSLDHCLPPLEAPADTEWVQRIRLESPRLSRFWGRPVFLGATVLLPKGYHTHPDAHYPVVYLQGHFERGAPFGFSMTPPSDGKKSWARQREEAAAQGRPPPEPPAGTVLPGSLPNTETGFEFQETWTSEDFPRVMVVTFQHPTPYFDDSYGVNSPNCGPYGDALLQELMPALEHRFRMIRAPYARVLTGSSTGGWGSLALQLYYPDTFGGAWAFSPDPVDFRLYYGGVNLYADENAFVEKTGPGLTGGGARNRSRSQQAAILGMQDGSFEWWKHTSMDASGYPLPVWDLATGRIDRAVVESMRANGFDLREYLARNWTRLGPKLAGKLHVCAADMDAFYSHLAVRLLEEFLVTSKDPHVEATFQYGPPGSTHGWRPTTHAELIRTMARHIERAAPDTAKLDEWHYR
ncbi:MAG: hypothetical protein JNN01_20135 [Opitutaceae bacterium]|nr:hypothetical protein [Opitutaceae bacterium]